MGLWLNRGQQVHFKEIVA